MEKNTSGLEKFKQIIFSKKNKDRAFIFLMLLLPVAQFAVFYVYVNVDSILMAFQIKEGDAFYWGIDNFKTLFEEFGRSDSIISGALLNTFLFFVTAVGITFPLSFLLCFFLYKKIAGYKIFRVIFFLPNIISASVIAVLFKYLIMVDGPIDSLMEAMGGNLPALLSSSKYALNTIVFYTIFFGLGGNLVLFSGAMSHIDESVIEAGKIDGAGLATEMLKIVVPLMWPTISTVLILNFIGIFNASGPILLFTRGEWDTFTISYWIYDEVTFSNQLNYPAAVGLFFTAVGAPIAIFMRWLLSRGVDDVSM